MGNETDKTPDSPWQPIDQLPDSDDLFWFLRWDSAGGYSEDGPRRPQAGGYDAEEWSWFAPCESPPIGNGAHGFDHGEMKLVPFYAAPPSAPVGVPSAKTLASVVWSDWMTNEQADRLGDALHKWLTAYFAQQPAAVDGYTTGHCERHKQPGGCDLHNLHCGWPECDRRPAAQPGGSDNDH